MAQAFFSIIVPVYNRAGLISRTLDSCLAQEFRDYEVIIIDDGSTDGSSGIVQRYTNNNKSFRLLRHDRNRGVCPARNTGINAARGSWVVALDSDDELLPGALATIYKRATEVDGKICGLRFMCTFDNGELSPMPPLVDEVWSYADFIRFWNVHRYPNTSSDALPCARRSTFATVCYPNNHAFEGSYHLNFARRFSIRACPDVVRVIHSDASERLSYLRMAALVEFAADHAESLEQLLSEHGQALSEWAPDLYCQQVAGLATQYFLAGQRRAGMRTGLRYLARRPTSVKGWAILGAGMIGPKATAYLKTIYNTRQT